MIKGETNEKYIQIFNKQDQCHGAQPDRMNEMNRQKHHQKSTCVR